MHRITLFRPIAILATLALTFTWLVDVPTAQAATCSAPFTMKVNTALGPAGGGAASNKVSLQLTGAGSGVVVDWGGAGTASPAASGTSSTAQVQPYGNPPGTATYTYSSAGSYTITVCGTISRIGTYGQHAITSVTSFGNIGLTDLTGAFQQATNLTSVPATLPAGVTSTVAMFAGATTFNGAVGGWDTSSVTSMIGMFNGASAFNQNLGKWNITQVAFMNQMLDFTGMSISNYNATLIGWAAQSVRPRVALSATGVEYSTPAVAARDKLRNTRGWSIADAGLAQPVTAGKPTISGTAKAGQTLTASPGTWTPSNTTFRYQWLRDNVAVPGATNKTYVLTGDDVDHFMTVQVTGSAANYSDAFAYSLPTGYVTPSAITPGTVKITGTPQVLRELKADRGTWSPSGLSFSYQWLRNGVAIPGATFTNYFPTDADVGKKISVRVTGSKAGYPAVAKTSAATATVTAAPGGTVGTPTINGSPTPGSTLTALPGTWTPSSTTFTYQWLRDGALIAGATNNTIRVTTADVGHRFSVKVTGKAAGYANRSITSGQVTIVKTSTGVTSGSATVAGTPRPGNTLTAATTGWTPSNVTFRYQWLRDNRAIPGATGKTLALTNSDQGHTIAVIVYGDAFGYSTGSAYSAPVTVRQSGISSVRPTITGTPAVHSELKANWGTWSPAGVTLRLQWLRDGAVIPGAVYANYYPSKDDIGKRISVRATGSLSGYTTVTRTSARTVAVVAAPAITPGTPSISGIPRPGNTLTAVPGTWKPSNVTLTYQWLRDNKVIPGATGKTIRLTNNDIGHFFTLKVTASAPGYTSIYRYSKPTDYVNQAGIIAGAVTITGTAQVQRELRVNWGTWSPSGVSIQVQWLRNGRVIPGATYANYYPKAADIGAKISVRVTGTKVGYRSVSRTSSQTKAVVLDVYTTPGYWTYNGRQWRTSCEPYSQTQRCRTEIFATKVTQVNGKFVQSAGWVFNNLTYTPLPESAWANNPLGRTGSFTSANHQWRTECHTATTGNGCRTYIYTRVIVAQPTSSGGYTYSWQWRWVLNNIVQFT